MPPPTLATLVRSTWLTLLGIIDVCQRCIPVHLHSSSTPIWSHTGLWSVSLSSVSGISAINSDDSKDQNYASLHDYFPIVSPLVESSLEAYPCDKKKPECSQCIRVSKKCPGYRDQLSLMFRDESTKVIQKAHAQWGTSGSPIDGGQGSSSGSPSSQTSWSPSFPLAPASETQSPSAEYPASATSTTSHSMIPVKLPRRVEPNLDQRGLSFYINRYLLNHPDSPRTSDDLATYCNDADASQSVMIAVGLAGMSNLLGNKSMNLTARSKYVTALKQTGQLVASGGNSFAAISKPLRSIIILALFEVVQGKGSKVSHGSANTHINGAVALLRSVLPVPGAPNGGARGVLQLMFSMFIPAHMTDTPLPPGFFECLELYERPNTNDLIQQLLMLENVYDGLESRLLEAYPFTVNRGDYPAEAVFRGKWHSYSELWGARLWNHYRWARILLNQMIVKFTFDYPHSSSRLISPGQRIRCYAVLERMAEDILVSTPSHWHHPIVDTPTAQIFEAVGAGGAGAVGLPSLLWHVATAGCAPNVPPEFWQWSYDMLQVVWKDMGMQHAVALSDVMREHRAKLDKEALGTMIKVEDEEKDW
ncbi:Uu.00g004320.m01.CDS01 [Anthostomella pinea]|uniref:Uu.00g004320.m01.CDS01 n=1 Tax=Anthostomella pinea TaxID=933095 RepID=A0AAI8YIT6_9PEZI|nr:Uu.00g004320.m01.CDS01 [Anthostomella pinea]